MFSISPVLTQGGFVSELDRFIRDHYKRDRAGGRKSEASEPAQYSTRRGLSLLRTSARLEPVSISG